LSRTFFGVDKNDILPFSILCGENFFGVTILGRWTFFGSCFRVMDFLGVKMFGLIRTSPSLIPLSTPPGGLWRFNNSLLSDSVFIERMRVWLASKLNSASGDIGRASWVGFKKGIKHFVIRYSVQRARAGRSDRDRLTKGIILLKRRMAGGEDVSERISVLEGDLRGLLERACEGVKVRSRVKWIEEGEKPTRFFF